MIFGLFKKEQMADIVFVNGNVYTQDADLPWAEAVACKDGQILYVGNSEDVNSLIGPETHTVDLEGKYMLPGLINTHSHPAQRVFKDSYIEIPASYELDDILGMMSDYVFNNPEEEVYFGFGFNDNTLTGLSQEEASAKLDEICEDKPMVILSNTEKVLWVNNVALEKARAAAQEDGILQISLQYFLEAVFPFDHEELQNKTLELMTEYCEKGFTSIFNAGCPEFMDNFYQEVVMTMCQQDIIKQRYFGSLKIIGSKNPKSVISKLIQKNTHTTEMDDYVHFDTLKIIMGDDEDQELNTDEQNIEPLVTEAAHRGFNVHIDVKNHDAFIRCMKLIDNVRNAGFRKNIFIIASDSEIVRGNEELSMDDMCLDNVFFVNSSLCEEENEFASIEGAENIEQVVDRLTIDAAINLGVSDRLGSIQKGKLADLIVLEENPFDLLKVSMFKRQSVVMTIVDGKIVYDAEEDNMSEWYDLISGIQV
ncbi:MAG: amidohydrolase family protein [Aminipila sp.]